MSLQLHKYLNRKEKKKKKNNALSDPEPPLRNGSGADGAARGEK